MEPSATLGLVLVAVVLVAAASVGGMALLLKGVQLEMRSVAERVTSVEQHQQVAGQGITGIGNGLAQAGTMAQSLVDATTAIRQDLDRAKTDLTALHSYARARQELETRTAGSIRRLEAIIAGTHSKGAAGENILDAAFSRLPVEWQVRDFRVGNRVVEFGLRLPNSLILPIDSKWPATELIEALVAADDPTERARLKSQVEAAVLAKAREVRKYVDPSLTVPFGVAAVPDAVYELCCGLQGETFQMNVVLVSYSMFVPYLLLVFQTVLKTSQNIDLEKLSAHLQRVQESTQLAQEELEGRFARAVTMLANSRDELGRHLSRTSSSLIAVQDGAGAPGPLGPPAGLIAPIVTGSA